MLRSCQQDKMTQEYSKRMIPNGVLITKSSHWEMLSELTDAVKTGGKWPEAKKTDRSVDEWRWRRSIGRGRVDVPQGERGLFSAVWGEKTTCFLFEGLSVRGKEGGGLCLNGQDGKMTGVRPQRSVVWQTATASSKPSSMREERRGRHTASPHSCSPPSTWDGSQVAPFPTHF